MLAFYLAVVTAHAAPIQWSQPADLLDATQIRRKGTLVEAKNFSDVAPDTVWPGGVPFEPSTGFWGSGPHSDPVHMLSGHTTGDRDLDLLIGMFDHAPHTSDTVQVGVDRLIPGHVYRLQLFYTDLRGCCWGRTMVFGDGLGHDVALDSSGVSAASFGQTVDGRFVADGTEQTLTVSAGGGGYGVHFNGYQLRDMTPGRVRVAPNTQAGGQLQARVSGLPPGHDVRLMGSPTPGLSPLSQCPGTMLGLGPSMILAGAVTDSTGGADLTRWIPAFLQGSEFYLQIVDQTDCTSGPVTTVHL